MLATMARQREAGKQTIEQFDIRPGRMLARKYEVIKRLGRGWEGEVFLMCEKNTAIERAVKLFYPQRNPRDKVASFYARKLHKLRHCPIAIQYHTSETINYRRVPITLLVSDFVEGELLSDFLARQPGGRLRFVHDVVREVAYAQLAEDQRVTAHRVAADCVRTEPALPVRLSRVRRRVRAAPCYVGSRLEKAAPMNATAAEST